jgi:hypothetical protein
MTIRRILSRRLERLEEELAPLEEPMVRVWQIVYLDSDGNTTEGERLEWSPTRPGSTRQPVVPPYRKRYR